MAVVDIKAKPRDELVGLLEGLLEQAKTGELRCLVYAAEFEETYGWGTSGVTRVGALGLYSYGHSRVASKINSYVVPE